MDQGKKDSVTHIHQIYIKASPQAIWDAITDPSWNGRYGYQAVQEYELKPGGKYRAIANEGMKSYGLPETIIDGEILEVKPLAKLVHTYRWHFSEELKAEGFTKLTYEIVPTNAGFCRLTITHDVTGAPLMSAATQNPFNEQGGGGWDWILSDLKSLLETGKTMSA
jgi:uncharacterized protein YndB with AHSA1/START domain